eukprot:947989-Amphidinium_carterae.2
MLSDSGAPSLCCNWCDARRARNNNRAAARFQRSRRCQEGSNCRGSLETTLGAALAEGFRLA